jgi:perosamine synthetase
LYAHLDHEGIDSNVHYYPNHMLPIFRAFTTRLPVTEAQWQQILTIPLHPDLSTQDQDRVIDSIRRFAAEENSQLGGQSNSVASA